MNHAKIGLLPLYIKLYDDCSPQMRKKIDAFHMLITDRLKNRGLDVIGAPVCRIRPEFEKAVEKFESEDADAVVTLHLAYSPSLESSDILAATSLPVIVLDTTPDFSYNTATEGEALSYNHGIHGVQDMCNLLRRNGKHFEIFAGHWEKSDVIDRVARAAHAAKIAKAIKNARVGIIGKPFRGMGDFGIPYETLSETIGIKVSEYDSRTGYPVPDSEIDAEYESDIRNCETEDIPRELYDAAAKVGLGIRKWIAENRLTAFTMNFLSSSAASSFSKMPFAEASKAMAAGIGYAGEGDVLTAALVGALLSVYPETSFTEMFCPDWEGGTVFLSHMGEFNLRCAGGRPKLIRKRFIYTDAGDTTAIIGSFKGGSALFCCLAPQAENRYMLIASEGEMTDISHETNNLQAGGLNGWFRPKMPVADFLERYSRLGGIHHAALIYDGDIGVLKMFAAFMDWDFAVI